MSVVTAVHVYPGVNGWIRMWFRGGNHERRETAVGHVSHNVIGHPAPEVTTP